MIKFINSKLKSKLGPVFLALATALFLLGTLILSSTYSHTVQAKVSTEVSNLVKKAIANTQKASTDITSKAYTEANSELTVAVNNVKGAISKTTDQDLKKNLSEDVANIEIAKSLINGQKYDQALKETQKVATSLDAHLKAADGGATTTTNTTNKANSTTTKSASEKAPSNLNTPTGEKVDESGQSGFVICGNTVDTPCNITHLFRALTIIINYLISMVGLVAILFIVIAGVQIVASQGTVLTSDGGQSQLTAAKRRLGGAITGLILVAVAFVLVNSLLAGSFNIGIRNGATILTNPKAYINEGQTPPSEVNSNTNSTTNTTTTNTTQTK